ncbi:hypothetical protein NFI96_001530 [Prochilodus magdalenae]|nr:hypothetical protein NFI96_001530 [Prochilodus magdalenae]
MSYRVVPHCSRGWIPTELSEVLKVSHPLAAPLSDGCTTQDYMHTDRYHDCPQHHVTVTNCGGVVPDCHGVTQNGSGSSSVTSPALVLVETTNESMCGGTVVSTKMNVRGTLNASADQETLDHSMLPTLWGQFGDVPFLFQHDRTPVHKASSIKTWMSESGVEELDWPAQSPDLHPIEQLWDGLERRLRARPSRPTSVSDLTDVLLEEWLVLQWCQQWDSTLRWSEMELRYKEYQGRWQKRRSPAKCHDTHDFMKRTAWRKGFFLAEWPFSPCRYRTRFTVDNDTLLPASAIMFTRLKDTLNNPTPRLKTLKLDERR